MLTANYTCGLGGGVADAISTPAQALEWARKFESFLKPIPGKTPVLVIEDSEPGSAQSSYASADGIAWISTSYLEALDKATSFAAEGGFPAVGGPVPGALKNLGNVESVLESLRGLITGLQMVPEATDEAGPKLYSRKAAIGVAVSVGFLAALTAFAVGWVRKPEPSSALYPGP
jgi:hypothetical protein